jgi:APA family basic amino acid/polyamine antiporter
MAFIGAAAVAALTGLSYARMARRIALNSPEFQFVSEGLGERAGFVAGWLMITATVSATAAVALGFAGYVVDRVAVPRELVAVLLLLVLGGLAWRGIQESISLVSLLTVVEVGGLLLVIVLGIPYWGEQSLTELPHGLEGLGVATALAFFAFIGFEQLGNLAEEMQDSRRTLPRAILLAIGLATLIYVLVAISAVSLVGTQVLAGSSAPLVAAVSDSAGPAGAAALNFIALAATSNTVLVLIISASRSLHGMAKKGALPGFLAALSDRRTPHHSIMVVLLIAGLIIPFGDIALVAQVANFAMLISFALVNASAARVLSDETSRSWRSELGRMQPIAAAVSCLMLAALTGGTAVLMGLALAGLGLAFSLVTKPVHP